MKFHRIFAIIYRHLCLLPKSIDRLTDLFFWPLLEVLTLGLTTIWLSKNSAQHTEILASVLSGVLLWRVVWQSNYEIGVNILEETWNKNLTNLLATPLTKIEWLTANLIVGIIKLILVLGVLSLGSHFLYGINIFKIIIHVPHYLFSLALFGWSLGFLASGIVLRFGMKAQAFTWTLASFFGPFCATFYAVSILPDWAQKISYALPATYMFESLRAIVLNNAPIPGYFLKSMLLNILYLFICGIFCNFMFERARKKGFDHLE